jgi:hypothetical protein
MCATIGDAHLASIACDLRMGTMWQCSSCGFIINGGCDPDEHDCDPRSVIRHQTAQLDETFAAFLSSPAGRFEQHYAQRLLKVGKRQA